MTQLTDNPLIKALVEDGNRLTAQRIAICNYLYQNPNHPSASHIHLLLQPQFPTMSLATVYNTLSLLQHKGLISEVTKASDGSIRFDANSEPHINLVCLACELIEDVLVEEFSGIQQAAYDHGFAPSNFTVTITGICSHCQKKKLAPERQENRA